MRSSFNNRLVPIDIIHLRRTLKDMHKNNLHLFGHGQRIWFLRAKMP
jgi:hypothetical protein